MSLFDALSKIAEQIEQHRELMDKSEATVEQVSVLPFIDALGYDTQNPADVRKQFPVLNSDAVDYAVLRDGEPIMFLEAKNAGEKLSAKHWKQLFEYFNADKARIGILTNGVEYRFYTDSVKQNIMDKEPFLTIHMLRLDVPQINVLEGFSRSRFAPELTLRRIKISNLLEKELNQPSDDFVKHFAKQAHSGTIRQTMIQEFRPIVKRAWDDLVDQEIARRLQRHEAKEKDPTELQQESVTNKPDPVVSSGHPEFIPVYGEYEGHKLKAELLRKSIVDGLTIAGHQIRYKGEMTWPKNAAVMAIRSVDQSFQPTKTYPNGFTFWHVVDPSDGKERMIRSISGWDNITDEALLQRVLSS